METAELSLEIVAACKRNDRCGQKQLYEHYRERVYRLAWRMVGPSDADDLTQQVFLQAFRQIQQFTGESRFGTWLYRLTVNECLQHLRRVSRHPTVELKAEPPGRQDRTASGFENQEILEKALGSLEPELRSIVLLREVDQLSYQDIAEIVGCAEGTVASRLNRARTQLRDSLLALGWSG